MNNIYARITPAGAGKTITLYSRKANHVGSPPQVRGKLHRPAIEIHKVRITPAGAGKTGTSKILDCIMKDHPRRCGENWK